MASVENPPISHLKSLQTICTSEVTPKNMAYIKMLSSIPQSKNLSKNEIKSIVLQASAYTTQLKSTLPDIFERRSLEGQHHDGRYFDLIPILILTSNTISDMDLTPETLYGIMALTVYHFEVDDFIEHVLESSDQQLAQDLETMLEILLSTKTTTSQIQSDSESTYSSNSSDDGAEDSTLEPHTTDIILKMQRFIEYHTHNAAVLAAPSSLQAQLRTDLANFIRAGILQTDHSKNFFTTGQLPNMSFYDWLYGTSINNSGGFPWCTVLNALLLQQYPNSNTSLDMVSSHLLSELRTHIAVKYRFTNDRTSLYRDRKEKNLNCVDFPEFDFSQEDVQDEEKVKRVQNELLILEAYEERVCDGLFEQLELLRCRKGGEERTEVKAARFFRAVEVIHGAFYELKSHR